MRIILKYLKADKKQRERKVIYFEFEYCTLKSDFPNLTKAGRRKFIILLPANDGPWAPLDRASQETRAYCVRRYAINIEYKWMKRAANVNLLTVTDCGPPESFFRYT